MKKLSFRDVKAYPLGTPDNSFLFTYPINPMWPNEAEQNRDSYFCVKCDSNKKGVEKEDYVVCTVCGTRFSDTHFNQGNSSNVGTGSNSRETGLLEADHGNKSMPYHVTDTPGGGSASVSWQNF